MPGLNVVALISGGKDSFFSLLHCQANGHKVTALANLHPPHRAQDGPLEDIESYMYQTIGHSVIPLYEQALGLPLYREEIRGSAVNQDKSYGHGTSATSPDETESILTLLRKVIQAHPEVNAVSAGAILSDYQRTRVESVALRLGLTPLAYLWQWPSLPPYDQESLLKDMRAVGQDARIIKVASGGLDETFLWQNVADQRTVLRLSKAAERFGAPGDGAVLGEGGEYETLAVSGPPPLWKGRIVVRPEDVHNAPGDAGSAYVRITNPSVLSHEQVTSPPPRVRTPPLFDPFFSDILENLVNEDHGNSAEPAVDDFILAPISEQQFDGTLILPNIAGSGTTPSEQVHSIMRTIQNRLNDSEHGLHDIAYSIITLRSMADFGAVNAVYGSYFTKSNPPARITIACAEVLPVDALLTIGITSVLGPREGLHVQSRSYWAPANIGPYSQAIRIPESNISAVTSASVFIAGQIPLKPATMELPEGSSPHHGFCQQATLSLQHLHRIGRSMMVKRWTFGIAFVVKPSEGDTCVDRARLLRKAWKLFHQPPSLDDSSLDDADGFDVWNLKYGIGSAPWRPSAYTTTSADAALDTQIPQLVVIQADSLPRGSSVEWVGYGKSVDGTDSLSVPPHLHNSLLHTFRTRILPPS